MSASVTAGGRPVTTRRPGRRLVAASLFLVALNLRAAIAAVPPLVVTIERDLGISGTVAGLLTTLPVLCMGLLAPSAQRLAHAVGREGAIALALVALLAGQLLRLGGAHLSLLLLGTLCAGTGIALAGTVLPGVVKDFFPDRPGLLTGMTMFAMMLGAGAAAAAAVPLTHLLGGWQPSLAIWALPAALALVAWLPVVRRVNAHEDPAGAAAPAGPLPWRNGTAWLVAGYLAVQSVQFYSQLAWLAPTQEARGLSAETAGLLLSVFALAQVVSGAGAPALADRLTDRRPMLAAVVALALTGVVGMAAAAGVAPWLWAVLLGLGQGAGFSLGMVLVVDYAPTPAAAARLTAMAFLVSYGLAALGPLGFGALRDASGGFGLPWAVLVLVAVVQLALVPRLRPGRRVG